MEVYKEMRVNSRLNSIKNQLLSDRGLEKMANLNVNTKYRMLSGFDIPALGFGVSQLLL